MFNLTVFLTFQKLPYPKQVWFIVGNEFCERFSYYGMNGKADIFKEVLIFDANLPKILTCA